MQFKNAIQSGYSNIQIDGAIDFLDKLSETDGKVSVLNHPIITLLIGGLLAVIGGAAGDWDDSTIIKVVTSIGIIFYFCSIILGSIQSKEQKNKEFKRFLLWFKTSV